MPNYKAVPFSALGTENENGEIIDYEAPGTHNTEDEAIVNINKEDILHDLDALDEEFVKNGHKAKHVKIFNKLNNGMCSADITMDLGIPKATLSGDLKRISNIVINYN